MRQAIWLLLFFPGLCGSADAQDDLSRRLAPLVRAHDGDVSVGIEHLTKGTTFEYQADVVMPTASLIKVAVMIEAYRQAEAGEVDLDDLVVLREEDKVPGSGLLTPHFSAGASISVRDAIRLMIAYSDNTATNLVLDQVGLAETCATMKDLGFPNTQINAKVFRRDTSIAPERSQEFGLGSTTASEMVRLFGQLQRGKLVTEAACQEMIAHLTECQSETRIPRLLPDGTKVAHKTGSVTRVRCDAGIMFTPSGPIAICVLTSNNADRRWHDDNSANRLCGEIARITFEHFNSKAPESQPTILQVGSHGRLVEDLQRTLNARLDPSPDLSIDGDFGPITKAAVVRFQKQHRLDGDGVVESATWKALGPLVTQDAPLPAPGVVNAEQLTREPPDGLNGRPFVTCKAWAVADGDSGKLLWSHNADTPLDFASTTKVMTAYIVLKLAQHQPGVLDEEVVFSRRADETVGSTAGVRAGEKLSVRELLYGLMLPSGNDASVALAEHFGHRVGGESPNDADPLELFVGAMNATATELGMLATSYRNPHGLTAADHLSSATDLLKLTHAALQLDSFRKYVTTRQRGCQLVGPGGYTRNVVWKNTNQLLAIKGYSGVKTGTTTAAGACLISRFEDKDDHLLVVVLGSAARPARYTDTRNLFRWARQQRAAGD